MWMDQLLETLKNTGIQNLELISKYRDVLIKIGKESAFSLATHFAKGDPFEAQRELYRALVKNMTPEELKEARANTADLAMKMAKDNKAREQMVREFLSETGKKLLPELLKGLAILLV